MKNLAKAVFSGLLLFIFVFISCEKAENDVPSDETDVTGIGDYTVLDMVIDDSNTFWLGTRVGLFRFDGESWTLYTSIDGLICDTIVVLALDKTDKIWIGTQRGLSHFDGETWTNYTTADGMIENDIRSLTVDKNNNLWIGTQKNGLSKFDGTNFFNQTVNEEESFGMGHIHTVACDSAGNVWAGSCITGLSMFDGETWHQFVNNLKFFVMNSYVASNGDVWIGAFDGLFRYSNQSWEKFSTEDGLFNNNIGRITEDLNGNIWVINETAVSVFNGNSFQTTNYLENDSVTLVFNAIVCNPAGEIWLGGNNGLLQKIN